MKVLYLTINEAITSKSSGVTNKLLTKVSAIREYADDCVLLNASFNINDDYFIENKGTGYIDLGIGLKEKSYGYFGKYKVDKKFYELLADYITDNFSSYDRVLLRYPLTTPGLWRFSKKLRNRLVFEHNTMEVLELESRLDRINYVSFGLRPSQFFYWLFEKKAPLIYERFLAPFVFKNIRSGACVTFEIANYQMNRCKKYRTFVSGNFYDVNSVKLCKKTLEPKEMPTFGIIVTSNASWYGLDRLLLSYSKYQNKCKLVLAGLDANKLENKELIEKYNLNQNFQSIGVLSKKALHTFYNNIHVCFGSLALFRIGLNSATTLKVKESISLGIPVILGYTEDDIINSLDFAGLFYVLPNDNSQIDFDRLIEFVRGFYSVKGNQEKLRNAAYNTFDVSIKVKKLIQNISI